jgi:hypothetical protein
MNVLSMDESLSWGDSIRLYESSKKNLSSNYKDVMPVKRISLSERRVIERELDPIVMQYRNPEQERRFLDETLTKTQLQLSKPHKQQGKLNLFKIDNNDTLNKSIKNKKALPQRDYNILSHYSNDIHNKMQLSDPIDESLKIRPRTTFDMKSKRSNQREFNVISNRYLLNDEERQHQDYESTKNDVVKKYWKTHDFDIVKGEYLDENKETKFKEQRTLLSKVHGTASRERLPPSYKYNSGSSYNIVNHEVTDEFKLKVSSLVLERTLNRVKSHEVNEKISTKAALHEARDLDRREKWISYKHWQIEQERGYDPIFRNDLINDNEKQINMNDNNRAQTTHIHERNISTKSKTLVPPSISCPASAWDRLQKDDMNNVTAMFDATGGSNTLGRMQSELYEIKNQTPKSNNNNSRPNTTFRVRTGATLIQTPTSNQQYSQRIDPPPIETIVPNTVHRDLTKSKGQGINYNSNISVSNFGNKREQMLSNTKSVPALQSLAIPQLDLSRTEPYPVVKYNISGNVPPGKPISMRTEGSYE